MYQCAECKEIKFGWQFSKIWYHSGAGSVSERSNLCNKCAKKIAESAVYIAQQRLCGSEAKASTPKPSDDGFAQS